MAAGLNADTERAAVAESDSVMLSPPPPQAASVVKTRVERTQRVVVFSGSVILMSSRFGIHGCRFRLFNLGLWNNVILRYGNRFHTGKKIF